MTTADEDAIRRLIADIARAVCSGRLDAFSLLLDKGFRSFAPGGPVLHGRSEILLAIERWLVSWKADLRIVCEEIVADAVWGFCSGTFGLRAVHTGNQSARYHDGKFLAVVRKGEGDWRLYRLCHNSNVPET